MDETDTVFRKLLKAEDREEWLLVQAIATRVTVLEPGQSFGWLLQGKSLYLLGRRRALRLAKGRLRRVVYCEFGHCYVHGLMPKLARASLDRALKIDPKYRLALKLKKQVDQLLEKE